MRLDLEGQAVVEWMRWEERPIGPDDIAQFYQREHRLFPGQRPGCLKVLGRPSKRGNHPANGGCCCEVPKRLPGEPPLCGSVECPLGDGIGISL